MEVNGYITECALFGLNSGYIDDNTEHSCTSISVLCVRISDAVCVDIPAYQIRNQFIFSSDVSNILEMVSLRA